MGGPDQEEGTEGTEGTEKWQKDGGKKMGKEIWEIGNRDCREKAQKAQRGNRGRHGRQARRALEPGCGREQVEGARRAKPLKTVSVAWAGWWHLVENEVLMRWEG